MPATKTINAREVLWEASSFSQDYANAQHIGGWFDLSHWDSIEITGRDAADYLNRMSTLNFLPWVQNPPASGEAYVSPGAFLTGRGVPVVWGVFLALGSHFVFLVPPEQGKLALDHLEAFHFSEDLICRDISSQVRIVGIWSPKKQPVTLVARSSSGLWRWSDSLLPQLQWIWGPSDGGWPKMEGPQLGYRLFEFFRLERGLVRVGAETDERTLALEAGLEHSISEQKGCYPGQEVVERIRTYGRVNKRLVPVELSGVTQLVLPQGVSSEGSIVGTLVGAEVLPDDPKRAYGIAYLNRTVLDGLRDGKANPPQLTTGAATLNLRTPIAESPG